MGLCALAVSDTGGPKGKVSSHKDRELEYMGAIFQTTIDSEVIAYHIARDPFGFRPLCIGKRTANCV